MPVHDLKDYTYRGARALVILHDRAMREMLRVWKRARRAEIRLPEAKSAAYASLPALLQHGLSASRGQLTWLCEKLGLPDPEVDPAPTAQTVEEEAERYLEHLLLRWRLPFASVAADRFSATHKTRWGADMTCESMLEHAVLHATRHSFQLEELMEAQGKS